MPYMYNELATQTSAFFNSSCADLYAAVHLTIYICILKICHHSKTRMSETTAKLVTLRDKDTKFDVLESKMCSQCAYLTDVFSSGDRADSLQFDHHVNTLRSVIGVLRR